MRAASADDQLGLALAGVAQGGEGGASVASDAARSYTPPHRLTGPPRFFGPALMPEFTPATATHRHPESPLYRPWLHAYLVLLVIATYILIALGGNVTSLGAGMAVPDGWTTFGHFTLTAPPDVWWHDPDTRSEHIHRIMGTLVGMLTIGARKKLGLTSIFDLRFGDPLAVARLANIYPQASFIIPHFGAGMLRVTLMAMDAAPNIYVDTSSSNSWMKYQNKLTLKDVFKNTLDVAGPSRILFGTDSSYFPRGWQKDIYEKQVEILDALVPSAEDRAAILGGNARRVLGMPQV